MIEEDRGERWEKRYRERRETELKKLVGDREFRRVEGYKVNSNKLESHNGRG